MFKIFFTAKYCLDFYCPIVDSGPSNFIQQNHKFGDKNLNLLISVYKNWISTQSGSWHEISFLSWIQLVKRQRLIIFFNGNPFINYLRNTYICLHFCRVFDYIFSPIFKLYVWHFSLEQTVTSSFCWFGSYILR